MSVSRGLHALSQLSVSLTVYLAQNKEATVTKLPSFRVLLGEVVAERRAAFKTFVRCAVTKWWSPRTDFCRFT